LISKIISKKLECLDTSYGASPNSQRLLFYPPSDPLFLCSFDSERKRRSRLLMDGGGRAESVKKRKSWFVCEEIERDEEKKSITP
jgi:hypothetical protein